MMSVEEEKEKEEHVLISLRKNPVVGALWLNAGKQNIVRHEINH